MYHTLRWLLCTKYASALKKKLLQNRTLLTEQKDTDRVVLNTQNQEKVTFTVVELKQSLFETYTACLVNHVILHHYTKGYVYSNIKYLCVIVS